MSDAFPKPDISIVGTGIRIPLDLTIGAIEVLRNCSVIYTIAPRSARNWFVDTMNLPIENLLESYQADRRRKENYDDAVSRILQGAKKTSPVAYLTQGSPIFYDYVAQETVRQARSLGLSIQIVPSVSSVDSLMADLMIDIAPGIQIYEASWFVGYKIEPRLDIPCILLQISAFATNFATFDRQLSPHVLSPLRDRLLEYYPANHDLILVRSATSLEDESMIKSVKLQSLCDPNQALPFDGSMYIPAVKAPFPDVDFLTQMDNYRFFNKNYREKGNSQ